MSAKLITLLVALIASGGYAMVALLMAIQSACIPIPSEVIMPLAGYALAHTQLQLILLATVASLASNLGSIPAYWVGAKGGRPMVERYGRYLLLSKRDLDMARQVLQQVRVDHGAGRTHAADRPHVHRVPRGHRADEPGALPHLHLHRLVSVVLCAGVHRHEARCELEHATRASRQFFDRFHLGVELVIVIGAAYFVWTHWKNREQARHRLSQQFSHRRLQSLGSLLRRAVRVVGNRFADADGDAAGVEPAPAWSG